MFRAIGFVIVLIAVRLFMPDVFHAADQALQSLFNLVNNIAIHAPTSVNADASQMTAGFIVQPAPLPY